jgi:hypothetical protein
MTALAERLAKLTALRRQHRQGRPPKWLDTPPEPIAWERLTWLRFPADVQAQWVKAPSFLNYEESRRWAERWAERQGGRAERLMLSTGDTLVRLEPPA